MPEGGTLTLRTQAVMTERTNAPSATHVRMEVSDTGMGMDEEARRRCVEPFYTTKGERGTGLGLAMVYGMAQRHDAQLDIESERGRGTTVRLTFSAAASASTSTPRASQGERSARALRILLVDDDPLLRSSMQDILEGDGHIVATADGGQRGIDAFMEARESADPFEVVITDLGMPHVDGRRVAASIKRVSPRTPIILLTGWGRRMLAEDEVFENIDYVLAKPPRMADIRATLAELSVGPALLSRA